MFTKIAQKLAELAEQLDNNNLHKEADAITSVMIKIARFPASTEKAIVEHYKKEKNIKNVKKNFVDIPIETIRNILKKNKVLQKKGNQSAMPKSIVRELHRTINKDNFSVDELASTYGVSPKTIKRLLKTNPAKPGPKPKE